MRIPATKQSKEDQKQALLEKNLANEIMHNLVIKIISWKAGILDGAKIQTSNKISTQEWQDYKKHIKKISVSQSPEKTQEKLKQVEEAIREHDGFV